MRSDEIGRVGLGCMGMSEFYGATNDSESMRVLHRAADLGVRHFDTADTYGLGHNELLVGRFFKERGRDGLELATKFGIYREAGTTNRRIDNSAAYIRSACDASLTRLGVDCIDTYYVHRLDSQVPIEATMQVLAELVAAGKVRSVGLSEVSPTTLRRAHAVHPVSSLQTEYSLATRHVESELLPTCRELGVRFVAYSPIGRGLLSGEFRSSSALGSDDSRRLNERFSEDSLAHNALPVEVLRSMAAARGVSASTLAIAWVLHQDDNILPIPGTKRVKYLDENVAAAALQLSADELGQLALAFAPGSIAGSRYSAVGRAGVDE